MKHFIYKKYKKKKNFKYRNNLMDHPLLVSIFWRMVCLRIHNNSFLYFLIANTYVTLFINLFLIISFIFFIIYALGYDIHPIFCYIPVFLKQLMIMEIRVFFFVTLFLVVTHRLASFFFRYRATMRVAHYTFWFISYLWVTKNLWLILIAVIYTLDIELYVILLWPKILPFWLGWYMDAIIWAWDWLITHCN